VGEEGMEGGGGGGGTWVEGKVGWDSITMK
jgi:hypothetical protein